MKIDVNRAMTQATLLESLEYPLWGLVAPAGFRTDFASVPKLAQLVYPPTGYYGHAAVLHDLLCVALHAGQRTVQLPIAQWRPWMGAHIGDSTLTDGRVALRLTWKLAAYIFREQMRVDGVGWRTRWSMWLAVRAFGVLKGMP